MTRLKSGTSHRTPAQILDYASEGSVGGSHALTSRKRGDWPLHKMRATAASRMKITLVFLLAMIPATVGVLPTRAFSSQPAPTDVRSFMRSIVGEWIGTCEQSCDGEQADNKYFHITVEHVDQDTFRSLFNYYRFDKEKGTAVQAGESIIVTTIQPDGTAVSRITGNGTVLVDHKPKNQRNTLEEVLRFSGGRLLGEGGGRISVSGLPFGIGKGGRIRNAKSTWSYENGVLTIKETLVASFRAFIFSRQFDISASFSARRGSDVASLMPKKTGSARKRSNDGPDT